MYVQVVFWFLLFKAMLHPVGVVLYLILIIFIKLDKAPVYVFRKALEPNLTAQLALRREKTPVRKGDMGNISPARS